MDTKTTGHSIPKVGKASRRLSEHEDSSREFNLRDGRGRALPKGWKWVKFGNVIAESQSGFASGQRDSNGVIQLRMNNVDTRGNLLWNEFIRVPADPVTIEKYRLKPGDIVFNNTNSTELVGKSALFNNHEEPIVYSNHFTRLRIKPSVADAAFVTYWLISQWQTKTFEKICNRWIGQSAVKTDKLFALEIPLPPLDEQRRIASRLNEQLAAVESARKAADEQLQAARQLSFAYLASIFNNDQSEKWNRIKLGEIIEITAPQVDPKIPEYGSLPHVNGENIESGTCQLLYLNTAAEEGMTSGKYLFDPGDVLYSKLRPYLRKVVVADFKGVCSADMYPIKVNQDVLDSHFLSWVLVSDEFTDYADEESRRARMPKLNREQLFAYKAPIPLLDEQRQIAAFMREKIEQIKQIDSTLESQLAEINRLTASLLREAFAGGV